MTEILEIKIAEVLMEHFGFVPQAFSRRASDLSNEVLYSTMDSIEKVVKDRLGSSEDVEKVRLAVTRRERHTCSHAKTSWIRVSILWRRC